MPSNSTIEASVNSTPTIPPPPTIAGALADPYSILLGTATSFDVFVSGGAAPLTVVYSALPPGCSTHSTLTLVCIPTEAGDYTVHVNVTDSMKRSATGEVNLSVNPLPPPPVSPYLEAALALASIAFVFALVAVVLSRPRRGALAPVPG